MDKETGFSRVEVDAAPKLSKLPRDLSVVFVLDTSRSVADADVAGQLDLVRAYLSHVPKARFEIVLTSRFGARLNGRFVPAAEVEAVLATAVRARRFERRNGSAMERGIETAEDALSKRRGTRRIIVFSDGLLRTTFRLEDAVGQVAKGRDATTHLIIEESDGHWSGLKRSDAHALANVAVSTGGILATYSTPSTSELKQVTDDALGLVRPVQLDHFAIDGTAAAQARDVPAVLREGSGFRTTALTQDEPPAKSVTLRGMLWSKPVALEVNATEPFAKKTAAWVFPADMYGDLTRKQQLELAFFGNAVSPVTSFLAIEPGVRPSVDGLETGEGGGGVGEGIGLGNIGTIGHGTAFDLEGELETATQPCKNTDPPPPNWAILLAVETTRDEIVDVIVVPGAAQSARQSGLTKLDLCVIESRGVERWARSERREARGEAPARRGEHAEA